MKITHDLLVSLGPCTPSLEEFDRLFPQGTDLTVAALLRAIDAGLNVDWLGRKIFTAEAWAEYKRRTTEAWAEYARRTTEAWAESARRTAEPWAEYMRRRTEAWSKYEQVPAPAPARAEYARVTAQAWVEAAKAAGGKQ